MDEDHPDGIALLIVLRGSEEAKQHEHNHTHNDSKAKAEGEARPSTR
jgi:hypothetical protein